MTGPPGCRFFATRERPTNILIRELVGCGEHPSRVRGQDDAGGGVRLVVHYEDGSEWAHAMEDCEFRYKVEGQ
jgi:hypothetical protein